MISGDSTAVEDEDATMISEEEEEAALAIMKGEAVSEEEVEAERIGMIKEKIERRIKGDKEAEEEEAEEEEVVNPRMKEELLDFKYIGILRILK